MQAIDRATAEIDRKIADLRAKGEAEQRKYQEDIAAIDARRAKIQEEIAKSRERIEAINRMLGKGKKRTAFPKGSRSKPKRQ